jgi:hypothetical protein
MPWLLYPLGISRYPTYRRLGGPQGHSGWVKSQHRANKTIWEGILRWVTQKKSVKSETVLIYSFQHLWLWFTVTTNDLVRQPAQMRRIGKWLPSKVQTFRNLVLTNNLQGEILLFYKLILAHTVNTEIQFHYSSYMLQQPPVIIRQQTHQHIQNIIQYNTNTRVIFTASYNGFLWKLTAFHSHEILPILHNSTKRSIPWGACNQSKPTNLCMNPVHTYKPISWLYVHFNTILPPPLFCMLSPPTCPSCLPWSDHTNIWWRVQMTTLIMQYCLILSPTTSSLSCLKTPSKTLSICQPT